MAREVRERQSNTRAETVGGINGYMTNLGKYLERDQDEAGTAGATLASSKAEVHSIAPKLDGVRERSEGAEPIGGPPLIGPKL